MPVTKEYIGWSESLAPGVAQAILEATKDQKIPGGRAIDLSKHRIIVPSQFAGRLIREQLAMQSSNGVLLPSIETPESFLNWGDSQDDAASSLDALAAWVQVLMQNQRSQFPALFPAAQESNELFSFDDALPLAQTLYQLRDELGGSASGHDFETVANLKDNSEPVRWRDLARLETQYREILAQRQLRDHNDVRSALAKGNEQPEGVEQIWLAVLPDPQPLLITALERLKAKIKVKVLIGADATEAEYFDEWGRPIGEKWLERRSDWKGFSNCVHLVNDPTEGMRKLRQLASTTKTPHGVLSVCACDRETDAPRVAATLKSLGAEVINPLGIAHSSHAIHHALNAWALCLNDSEPHFDQIRQVFQIPAITHSILGLTSPEAFTLLNTQLDITDRAFIRGRLSEVIEHISSLPVPNDYRAKADWQQMQALLPHLGKLSVTLKKHRSLNLSQCLAEALKLIIGTQPLQSNNIEDDFSIKVAEALEDAAANLSNTKAQLNLSQGLKLVGAIAGAKRYRRSEATEAVNLPGWVEAPWEPTPHLIVYGLTDNIQPKTPHADPFLPASLREKVGLPSNDSIFATAAFNLEQLWRRREQSGRLDIIVPQTDASNNPLRPSRLLFLGPDSALTARVKTLFSDIPPVEAQPYWEIPSAHKFVPQATLTGMEKATTHISATAFKDYLADPAEYWLKHALKMSEKEHGDEELNAGAFGTLIHAALERFGRANLKRTVLDVHAIEQELIHHLLSHAEEVFGRNPPKSVQLQILSAAARLRGFAPVQADLFKDGWQIIETEGKLPELNINGVKITGRFDRIDCHIEGKKWRVYDYKTFSNAKKPEQTHFRKPQADETAFVFDSPEQNAEGKTKVKRWLDLQLPVYYHALHGKYPGMNEGCELEVGYICLPSEAYKCEEHLWKHFDQPIGENPNGITWAGASLAAITEVTQALSRKSSESFQPAGLPSKYPILPSLSNRVMADYLNISQLGEVKP